jgi:hypothetical protein
MKCYNLQPENKRGMKGEKYVGIGSQKERRRKEMQFKINC